LDGSTKDLGNFRKGVEDRWAELKGPLDGGFLRPVAREGGACLLLFGVGTLHG
jgi:hypothetical protein